MSLSLCSCEVLRITEQPPLTSIIQWSRLMLIIHLVTIDESADARRNLTTVPRSDWKRPAGGPHTSAGHIEERPIVPQPRCGRFHQAGTGQTTLGVSASNQKWCKLNNDDDDDDVTIVCVCGFVVSGCRMVQLILSGRCWLAFQFLSPIYYKMLVFGLYLFSIFLYFSTLSK